jgi:hypothetical protein
MNGEDDIRQLPQSLENHLRSENPLLADVVKSFRQLDRVTQQLGFFNREESHTSRIPWWPLISILGTYSSGKSAFINTFLKYPLQTTGNQAVDDKFTVICFTNDHQVRSLPGLALDADPRFPLYKISQAIDEVDFGQSAHIDKYLQLKTCPSEKLRGRILIDSPGFDADEQRSSTLRITNHIIDLSDLVLVFFDARHPESGSMQDTLQHLVKATLIRRDATKFLYILNQIDHTAREDNTEEVYAAWKRALAQYGLTTGSCYAIYNPELELPIKNDRIRIRLENRRNADRKSINDRIEQVVVERAYRIVGILRKTAHSIEQDMVSRITKFLEGWRRTVLWADAIVFGGLLLTFLLITLWAGYWNGLQLNIPILSNLLASNDAVQGTFTLILLIAAGYIHYQVRRKAAERVKNRILEDITDTNLRLNYTLAFRKNSRWWRSVFQSSPSGWNRNSRKVLSTVVEEANTYIQILNDTFTNPSGNQLFGDPYDQYIESKNADNAGARGSASPSQSFKEQALKVITRK